MAGFDYEVSPNLLVGAMAGIQRHRPNLLISLDLLIGGVECITPFYHTKQQRNLCIR